MDIHDIAGLEEEEYRPPESALQVHVDFYYIFGNSGQNETTEKFWNRIAKPMSEDVDKFLNKKSALQGDAARTVNADVPPDVKLRKIYAHMQKIPILERRRQVGKEEKHEQLKRNNNVEES